VAYEVSIEQRVEQATAVVRGRVARDGIAEFIGGAFAEVMAAVSAQHVTVVGPPFGRYRVLETGFEVEAGFPTSWPVEPVGRVIPSVLPGGEVATTMHVGSYDGVAVAYSAVEQWLGAHNLAPTGDPWESYLDGPEVPQPRTVVCFPCARRRPD
jgi:effector-binding domain-containing protein